MKGEINISPIDIDITAAPTLPVVIDRPVTTELVRPAIPIDLPWPDHSLSLAEELQLKGEATWKAIKLAWKWLPVIVTLIYGVLVMDLKAILKSAVSIILAVVVQFTGIATDWSIAGISINDIIETVLVLLAGWFLPQLRYLAPQWLRELMGWKVAQ